MSPARHAGVLRGCVLAGGLFALVSSGCAHSSTPSPASADGPGHPTAASETDGTRSETIAASPRALGVGATFADLVLAVRRLDAEGGSESAAGCLLRGGDRTPFSLEADLASAVHPIPDAPSELASRLDDPRESVTVLTRWAQHGGATGLTLVALTATPPPGPGPLAIVVLTREGVYLRRSEGSVPAAHAGPFPVARLGEHLPVVAEGTAGLVVSAEAAIPLASLHAALANVPRAAPPVVLGLALEPGVRLPTPPGADPSVHGLCPEGVLSEPPAGQQLGTLPTDVLRARVANMAEGAIRCFEFARGDAARGGRMRVLTRIGREGRVTEACASADELGDPTLRACVLGVVRSLVFPALPAGDYVDVALPLRLVPDTSEEQRPLCDSR